MPEICQRIAHVRLELYGQRGKARFAKELGISPSTYSYYELDRVPPADLLVKVADLGGVDLRWLLTGQTSVVPVPASHPAVGRVVALLADRPAAAEPLMAFVELLAASLAWPDKHAQPELSVESSAAAAGADETGRTPPPPRREPALAHDPGPAAGPALAAAGKPMEEWIPVLGRSAAGLPQFWPGPDLADGITLLQDLVARHARRAQRQVQAAVADESGGTPQPAQVITLSSPEPGNVAEFVSAGALKRRHPDAFAVRIDGDSMAPEFRHGDIAISSASSAPVDGAPALVQLAGQIGVTCKLYRRQGENVHLVPVNEQYAPQAFPAGQVVWAKRVLARVRPR